MSPDGLVLIAEILANQELNVDAILAHVADTAQASPPTCFQCEKVLTLAERAWMDTILLDVEFWYCSEACRMAHRRAGAMPYEP